MTEKRIKIAIDGCGALTMHSILPHLSQPDFQERAEITAICDIVGERAAQAAQAYAVPQVYTDYETMLRESGADAVLIIVPAGLHAEHAVQAARYGLHAYLQKPMATSFSEAQQVTEAFRQSGTKLVAAPGMALWPLYQTIRGLIEQNQIGIPYLAQAPTMGWGGETLEFPTNPAWFFGKTGGPLRDEGGYSLGTLLAIFGPVQRVTAFSGIRWPQRGWNGEMFPVTGDDNTAALLDFGGNLFGLWPEAWCESSPSSSVLRIHGLNGSIETDFDSANQTHVYPFGFTVFPTGKTPFHYEVNQAEIPALSGEHTHISNVHVYADILHLVDCIQENREPAAGAAVALHMVEVTELAFQAAASGQAQVVTTRF